MPNKGNLKTCLHELMFKRLWKSCVKGSKESVPYVLKHLKMQYWHLVLTGFAGNACWQVGEILLLVYVLFVGIFKTLWLHLDLGFTFHFIFFEGESSFSSKSFCYEICELYNLRMLFPFTGKWLLGKILLQPQLRVASGLMLRKIGWSLPKLLFSCVNLRIFACWALRASSSASGLPFLISFRFLFLGKILAA